VLLLLLPEDSLPLVWDGAVLEEVAEIDEGVREDITCCLRLRFSFLEDFFFFLNTTSPPCSSLGSTPGSMSCRLLSSEKKLSMFVS
jgi:hypothetical protein